MKKKENKRSNPPKAMEGKERYEKTVRLTKNKKVQGKLEPVHEKYHQSVEIHERKVLLQSFPENFLRNIDKLQRNITSNYVSQGK
jgi:hypothetical protein